MSCADEKRQKKKGVVAVMESLAIEVNHSVERHSSKPKIPHKWQRVLAAFLSGQSHNRFSATRELRDWCLHSTVSTLESKGVKISRKNEKVPGYLGVPTDVTRYWLDLGDVENVKKARELLGEGA
jgi:hypothetical protein